MVNFLWLLIVFACIGLIYLLISIIAWDVFNFIDDPVLHGICAFWGVYFFHTKLIFRGS